jgi:hypothetical protein
MRRCGALVAISMVVASCTGSSAPDRDQQAAAAEIEFQGQVVDSVTGQPISGATLAGADQQAQAGDDGQFLLAGIPTGTSVTVESCAHQPTSVEASKGDESVTIELEPIEYEGRAISNLTGKGVKAAILTDPQVTTKKNGKFTLTGVCPGDQVTLKAKGYSKTRATMPVEGDLEVELAAGPDTTFRQVVAWEANQKWKLACSMAHRDTRAYISVAQCVSGFRSEVLAGYQAVSVKIKSVTFIKWTFPGCALSDFGPRTYRRTAAMDYTYQIAAPFGGVVSSSGIGHWVKDKKDGTWRWFPLWRCATPLP